MSPETASVQKDAEPPRHEANAVAPVAALNGERAGFAAGWIGHEVLSHPANASVRTVAMRRAQQSYGNRYLQRFVAGMDRVVPSVPRLVQRQCACGGICEGCRAGAEIGESPAGIAPGEKQQIVQAQSASAHGGMTSGHTANWVIPPGDGQPLNEQTRSSMESHFGTSFGDVRVHSDTPAAASADALGAHAYTSGRDIYFAAGKYAPTTRDGRSLLAHELTHVVQQMQLAAEPESHVVSENDESEREAEAVGERIEQADLASPRAIPLGAIQRDTDPHAVKAPVLKGKLVAVWGTALSRSKIFAGDVLGANKDVSDSGLTAGFASYDAAVGHASVLAVANYEAGSAIDGAVIIQIGQRFYAYEIKADTILDNFTRKDLEAGLNTLSVTKAEVQGVRSLITRDGYIAPITAERAPSPEIPTYIIDPSHAGGYWHSTEFPKPQAFDEFRKSLAKGQTQPLSGIPEINLALFKGMVRATAIQRVQENRALLPKEEAKYQQTGSDDKQWVHLRELIEKDQDLAKKQSEYETRLVNAQIQQQVTMTGLRGPIATPFAFQQFSRDIDELREQVAEIKMVRNALRAYSPALAVLDPTKITKTTTNEDIYKSMKAGFKDVNDAIDSVLLKLHRDDVPLAKLGPVVEEVKDSLGVTEAKRKEGDPVSTAVLNWLEKQERTEQLVTWIGTILTIILAIGAFIATGGLALLLGLAASGIGLGTAVYEFNRSDALWSAAKAGKAGAPLVDSYEEARFNYIMAWVNIVLAGLDVGLTVKGASAALKGARGAEKLAGTAGGEILSKLKPQDIELFDKAINLRQAGKAAEAEKILADLRPRLGGETIGKLEELFARRAALDKVLDDLATEVGGPTAEQLRLKLGDELIRDIGVADMKRIVTGLGKDAEEVLKIKNTLGESLFKQLATKTGELEGLSGTVLRQVAEQVGRDTVEKLGTDAVKALAKVAGPGEIKALAERVGEPLLKQFAEKLGAEGLEALGRDGLRRLVDEQGAAGLGRLLRELEPLTGIQRVLRLAKDWVRDVLKFPASVIADLTLEGIQRLRKLAAWILERLSELTEKALRLVLGCDSPCKVTLEAIEKYFKSLTPEAKAGSKLLKTADEVVAALPKGLNITKIKEYLQNYPALLKLIEKAEITDLDLAKIADFLTKADAANPKTAYQTFTKYLTQIIPSKTGANIEKLNEIVAAVLEADVRQGAALKGPIFEAFVKQHVPEFAGKALGRATFPISRPTPPFRRVLDLFDRATGEVWQFKHQIGEVVRADEVADYSALIGTKSTNGDVARSINYLFPTKEAAELNKKLAEKGFSVFYIESGGKLEKLF
jgi:hypothetical protein